MKKVLEQVAVGAVTLALAAVIVWFVWALAFAPDAVPEPNCTLPNGDRIYVEADYGDGIPPEAARGRACEEAIREWYVARGESRMNG